MHLESHHTPPLLLVLASLRLASLRLASLSLALLSLALLSLALLSLALLSLVLLSLAGCGPAPRPRAPNDADLRDISEGRAMELIREVAAAKGATLVADWRVQVGGSDPFPVDLRIGDSSYGIEWVSPQDRADYGDLLPAPNARQLQVMPGVGDDADAQVLVIDYSNYRYEPDLERVQRGSRGNREAESSVRNYVRDFFEYARGQGAY